MTEKPNNLPVWASADDAEKVEPSSAKKKRGWERYTDGRREKPFFQYFNWWQNLVFRWINYFNDEAVTKSGEQTIVNKTLDKVNVTGFIDLEERSVKPFYPEPEGLRLFAKKDDTLYIVNSNDEEISLKGERGKILDSINLLDCSLLPSTDTEGNLSIELCTFEGGQLSTTNPARIAFKAYTPQGEIGQNWSPIDMAAIDQVLTITNKDNTFVSGGKSPDTNMVSINDGITWASTNIDMVNAVAAGNSGFVAVGDRCRTEIDPDEPDQNINEFGGGCRSDDGMVWENIADFKDKTLHSVAHRDGTFIATGNKAYDDYDVCSAEAAVFNPDSYLSLVNPPGRVDVSTGTEERLLSVDVSATSTFVPDCVFRMFDQYLRNMVVEINILSLPSGTPRTYFFDLTNEINTASISYTAGATATRAQIVDGLISALEDHVIFFHSITGTRADDKLILTAYNKGVTFSYEMYFGLSATVTVPASVYSKVRYMIPVTWDTQVPTIVSKVNLNLVKIGVPDAQLVVDIIDISGGHIISTDNSSLGTSNPVHTSMLITKATSNNLDNTKVSFYFPTPVEVSANYGIRIRVLSGSLYYLNANVCIYSFPSSTESLFPGRQYAADMNDYQIVYNFQIFHEIWSSDERLCINSGGYYLTQPFSSPGMLVSGLSYKLFKWGSPTFDLYVELRSSEDELLTTSAIVSASTLLDITHTNDTLWVDFNFPTPRFLSANTVYNPVLKMVSAVGMSNVNNVVFPTVLGDAPHFTLTGTSATRKAEIRAIGGHSFVGQTFTLEEDISRIMFKIFKSGTPTAPLAVDVVNLIGGVPNPLDVVATSVAVSKDTPDLISGGITSDTTSIVFSFDPPVPSSPSERAVIVRTNGAGGTSDIRVGVDETNQKLIMRVNDKPWMAFDRDSYISYAPISMSVSISPSDVPLYETDRLYSTSHIYGQTFLISPISSAIKISDFTVKLCKKGSPALSLVVQIVELSGGFPNLNDVKCTSEPVLSSGPNFAVLPNVTFDNVDVNFTFANPVLLDAATEYALVLRALAGGSGDDNNYVSLVSYHELDNQRPYMPYNGTTWDAGFMSLYLNLTYTTFPFQTFRPNWPRTVPSNHTPITSIDVNLLRIGSPTVSLVLDIVSPSDLNTVFVTSSEVLASSLMTYEDATQENTAATFHFDPPYYVDAANEYTVIVRVTGSGLFDELNTVHILTSLGSSVFFTKIKHYGKTFLDEIGFYTSTDTVNWSFSEFITPTPLNRIKATSRGFLTTTVSGDLYRKNGTSWDVVIPNFEMLGCASDALGTIVVGSSEVGGVRVPKCFKSDDDITWLPVTIAAGVWFTDITVAANTFFAVGDGAYLSKDRGLTWSAAPFDSSGWPPISTGGHRSLSSNPTTLTSIVMGGVSGTNFRVTASAFPDLKYVMKEVVVSTSVLLPKESTLGVYDANVHLMHVYALNAQDGVRLAVIVRGCRAENKSVYATSLVGLKSQDCLGAEESCQDVFGRYLGTLKVKRIDNKWFALPSVSYDNPYPTPYALTSERAKTLNRATVNYLDNPDGVIWNAVCWSPELGMFCVVGALD